MARSKSSQRWLKEHFDDPYVQKAQKEGYRSRASYKLIELDDKDRLIKPGMRVVDLGAAPGGWSQVAAKRVGSHGFVLASDILPMDSHEDVRFVRGDFTEQEVFDKLLIELEGHPADLVISDMAPNMSGVKGIDQTRAMFLVELSLDMAQQVLKRGGAYVTKIFHGEGFDDFVKLCRTQFDRVVVRKPDASRPRSPEVYLVATGFREEPKN